MGSLGVIGLSLAAVILVVVIVIWYNVSSKSSEEGAMRILQLVLGMSALFQVTIQSVRHPYVLWIEPRESVLTKYEEADPRILAAKDVGELTKLYEDARRKVEEWERDKSDKEKKNAAYYASHEPHKSAKKLKGAIETWETHHKQICELHFYWWCGAACLVVGLPIYFWVHHWLGMVWLIAAFAEMIWWTSPSYRMFSSEIEFDRLLLWKFIYSLVTLVLLLGLWMILVSRRGAVGRTSLGP